MTVPSDDLLLYIQKLQFSDKPQAETLLVSFLRETFPLDVQRVELRPLATSLNSFNGFMSLADGRKLFFKTHAESDTVIGEYYRASMLADAGYPVLQPIYSSTQTGRQILIYEVIEDPAVFDVAWQIETGQADGEIIDTLTQAQNASDDQLLTIYLNTLEMQSADDVAQAAVHQLFYHRLTGGRLARFYGEPGADAQTVPVLQLDDGEISMHLVRQWRWTINGQRYAESLDEIIGRAIHALQPAQSGPSIIGHGDAHNGNVFLRSQPSPSLLYFDPAFAGRHSPLLDIVKPIFHNVFAMWMYFAREKAAITTVKRTSDGDRVTIEHDYALHPIRLMFLRSKFERVLTPIVGELARRGWLDGEWRTQIKSALFCCPFLTMNLADAQKFPPSIALIGLVMSVEMGAESTGNRSLIDRMLDEVERALV